ncbi:MAG: ammonia-forming cytochrome c nitrite reductase subunit c552 [Candidatus Odinarchaeota archaeon]
MNDRQELDDLKNQSRWSGKRFVLLYWMALMFLGTGFAIGLGTGVLNPKYTADADTYHDTFAGRAWHPDECKSCHESAMDGNTVSEYAEWATTGHATVTTPFTNATGDYVNLGGFATGRNYTLAAFNASSCSHCMTTRWNSTGDDSYWDFGITCAACHDAGVVNHTASNCGQCHGQNDDYDLSMHPHSLADMLASGHPRDSCLHCVSGQSLYWSSSELVLSAEGLVGVSCATCHDPHNNTYDVQLRVENTTALCGGCHGGSGHHRSLDMFTAGLQPHSELECGECHGYSIELSHGELVPYVNHTFVIDMNGYGCNQTGCHADPAAQMVRMEEIQNDTLDLFEEFDTLLKTVNASLLAANATANVDLLLVAAGFDIMEEAEALADYVHADQSTGFHNPSVAETKILAAIELLNLADSVADEAVAKAAPPATNWFTTTITETPGFELLAVLFTLSVLGAATFLLRKRRN